MKVLKYLRNLLIIALVVVSCGYAVKQQLKVKGMQKTVDSLRTVLAASYVKLDSLKLMQDNEAMLRDSLDDVVDRRLAERSTEAMIVMDTTLEYLVARGALERSVDLGGWVDTLCAPYPEGVSAHVKLHFIQSRATRLERLNHHLSTKFPEHSPLD